MLHSMNNPVVFVWPRPLRLHFIAAQLFRVFWCNTWAQRRPFICLPLCSGPFYLLLVQSHPLKMSTHNAPGQVCRCCRCCGNGDNNRLIKTRMERWSEVWEGVTVQPLIPKLLFARLCDFCECKGVSITLLLPLLILLRLLYASRSENSALFLPTAVTTSHLMFLSKC